MAYNLPLMGAGGLGFGIPQFMKNLFPNAATQAGQSLGQIPGTIKPYYEPYINAGQQALSGLPNMYNQMMQNPGDIISRLGAGYQTSPGYNFRLSQGLQGITNAAAAGGMAGTPMHQQQAGELAGNLASQDYEQYLNHVLGLFGGGLSGEQGLASMGYGASNELATNLAQQLMSQASLQYAGQNAQNQQTGGLIGNILGLFSGGGKSGGGGFFGF